MNLRDAMKFRPNEARETVLKATRDAGGIRLLAARDLGVTPTTYRNLVERLALRADLDALKDEPGYAMRNEAAQHRLHELAEPPKIRQRMRSDAAKAREEQTRWALQQARGQMKAAAKLLQISRAALYERVDRYEIWDVVKAARRPDGALAG